MSDITKSAYAPQKNELVKNMAAALPAATFNIFSDDADELAKTHPAPLKVNAGDKAPLFNLPNAEGKFIAIADVLKYGPVVLVFYRGTWCPYCNLMLKTYQEVLPEIKALGAGLIAISPQTPDNSLSIKEKNELTFEVLSDAGNAVAKQYTTVFKNGDASTDTLNQLGVDLHSFYSDNSGELPVPAVFIIGKDGVIAYTASKGGDFRERIESAEILDALKNIVA